MTMPAEDEEDAAALNFNVGNNSRKRRAEAASSEENSKLSADEEQEVVTQDPPGASSVASPTEEELVQQRTARIAETDARFRQLAQELCPLIDRFGRVLTDLAPHLWELGEMDATASAQNSAASESAGPAAPPMNGTNAFEASLLALLRER